MRLAFVKALHARASKDKRIVLITGDLGYSVFEQFQTKFPRQYLNAGVAEQNMTGIAAGMAIEGKIPIIYSIIPFVTMRNLEQIRNDICYQNTNVKIVAVGAGFSYGPYGHTHHGLEDIGILRTLPNLIILCPGDPIEVKLATDFAFKHQGPVYIRLGKAGESVIHKRPPKFILGKGLVLKLGKHTNIITTSNQLTRGIEVIRELNVQGIHAGLISMPFIKPLDVALILRLSAISKAIFTLEEHNVIGGLGSAVAEVLAENTSQVLFKRIGVPDRFTKVIGRQEFMQEANGLGLKQIVTTITEFIKNRSRN